MIGAEQDSRQNRQDWTFRGFAPEFDAHVREQLPWYDMATAAVAMIARHYIPQGGRVYDLGCSTGNIGRVLAPTLHEREARLVALDECRDMVAAYRGPGRAITAACWFIGADRSLSPSGAIEKALSLWEAVKGDGGEP